MFASSAPAASRQSLLNRDSDKTSLRPKQIETRWVRIHHTSAATTGGLDALNSGVPLRWMVTRNRAQAAASPANSSSQDEARAEPQKNGRFSGFSDSGSHHELVTNSLPPPSNARVARRSAAAAVPGAEATFTEAAQCELEALAPRAATREADIPRCCSTLIAEESMPLSMSERESFSATSSTSLGLGPGRLCFGIRSQATSRKHGQVSVTWSATTNSSDRAFQDASICAVSTASSGRGRRVETARRWWTRGCRRLARNAIIPPLAVDGRSVDSRVPAAEPEGRGLVPSSP